MPTPKPKSNAIQNLRAGEVLRTKVNGINDDKTGI